MHSSTARGFYVMLLNRGERERLRDLERGLPQGRYLIPREIELIFKLDIPKEPEKRCKKPEEVEAMDELWQRFNREIWKAKKMDRLWIEQRQAAVTDQTVQTGTPLTRLGQMSPVKTGETSGPMDDADAAFGDWVGMDADERFNWGEYVVSNYRRPRRATDRLDDAYGMVD